MRRYTTALTLLVGLLAAILSRAQTQAPTENEVWQFCKPPAYSPRSDTVARELTLDSMRVRITGRWRLVEIGSGWASPHSPGKVIELELNRQGKGLIYEQGQLVAQIQLTLRRSYDLIFFRIEQQGQSVFHFATMSRHGGLINACPQNLVIGNGRADGTAFAFRRIQ